MLKKIDKVSAERFFTLIIGAEKHCLLENLQFRIPLHPVVQRRPVTQSKKRREINLNPPIFRQAKAIS